MKLNCIKKNYISFLSTIRGLQFLFLIVVAFGVLGILSQTRLHLDSYVGQGLLWVDVVLLVYLLIVLSLKICSGLTLFNEAASFGLHTAFLVAFIILATIWGVLDMSRDSRPAHKVLIFVLLIFIALTLFVIVACDFIDLYLQKVRDKLPEVPKISEIPKPNIKKPSFKSPIIKKPSVPKVFKKNRKAKTEGVTVDNALSDATVVDETVEIVDETTPQPVEAEPAQLVVVESTTTVITNETSADSGDEVTETVETVVESSESTKKVEEKVEKAEEKPEEEAVKEVLLHNAPQVTTNQPITNPTNDLVEVQSSE